MGKSKREKLRVKRGIEKAFGSWTKEEGDKFDKIIDDAFEQVNPESWK